MFNIKNSIKKTLILILFVFCTILTIGSALYLLDKYNILKIPDNWVFDLISQEKEEDIEDSETTDNQEEEEPDQETLFTGDITAWPEDVPKRFPVFDYGTYKTATGLGENDRYDSAWILEFTGVTQEEIDAYSTQIEADGWKVSQTIVTDIWTITGATKDSDEISFMLRNDGTGMNLELISY